jgi:hypothetical protein
MSITLHGRGEWSELEGAYAHTIGRGARTQTILERGCGSGRHRQPRRACKRRLVVATVERKVIEPSLPVMCMSTRSAIMRVCAGAVAVVTLAGLERGHADRFRMMRVRGEDECRVGANHTPRGRRGGIERRVPVRKDGDADCLREGGAGGHNQPGISK